MRSTKPHLVKLAFAAALCVTALGSSAQTVENPVSSGGTLIVSDLSTTTDNVLAPAPSTFGFSSNLAGSLSANGFYYSDYLINVTDASAESVATTLTNSGGVSNLSERIYAYGGSFLGDAKPAAGVVQVWSTNYPLPGASVSVISPTALTAGEYVVELRGTSTGTFGGTLTLAPVPEPKGASLALLGLVAMGFLAYRRRQSLQA